MSTTILLLDCRSCWQYLRKEEVLPFGVYVVPFWEGQPRIMRAAAVVVGVLTEDVEDMVEDILVGEDVLEEGVEDRAVVIVGCVDCVEAVDEEVETGSGADVWDVAELLENVISIRFKVSFRFGKGPFLLCSSFVTVFRGQSTSNPSTQSASNHD